MQVESVGKIPDLFDELTDRADKTIKKMQSKTEEAASYAAALAAIVETGKA